MSSVGAVMSLIWSAKPRLSTRSMSDCCAMPNSTPMTATGRMRGCSRANVSTSTAGSNVPQAPLTAPRGNSTSTRSFHAIVGTIASIR